MAFRLDPYNIEINEANAEFFTKVGQLNLASQHYKFLALKDAGNIKEQIDCAIILAKAGSYRDALFFYLRAVKMDPSNSASYNNIGNIYIQLQRPDSAIYFYKKTVALGAKSPELYVNLGTAYYCMNDNDNALKSFDAALALNKNLYSAYIGKGMLFDDRINHELAENEYKQAIKIDPNNGIGYKKLGLILIAKGDYKKAVETCSKAYLLMANDTNVASQLSFAYFKYGNSLYQQGKYYDAITQFDNAVQYAQKNEKPKIQLAWAHYKLAQEAEKIGDANEEIEQLKKAAEIEPEFVEANYNLGILLIKNNKPDEAFKYVEQVYKIKPHYHNIDSIYNNLKVKLNVQNL